MPSLPAIGAQKGWAVVEYSQGGAQTHDMFADMIKKGRFACLVCGARRSQDELNGEGDGFTCPRLLDDLICRCRRQKLSKGQGRRLVGHRRW